MGVSEAFIIFRKTLKKAENENGTKKTKIPLYPYFPGKIPERPLFLRPLKDSAAETSFGAIWVIRWLWQDLQEPRRQEAGLLVIWTGMALPFDASPIGSKIRVQPSTDHQGGPFRRPDGSPFRHQKPFPEACPCTANVKSDRECMDVKASGPVASVAPLTGSRQGQRALSVPG